MKRMINTRMMSQVQELLSKRLQRQLVIVRSPLDEFAGPPALHCHHMRRCGMCASGSKAVHSRVRLSAPRNALADSTLSVGRRLSAPQTVQ